MIARFFLILSFFLPFLASASDALYLTYPGNPARSMAIHWLEKSTDRDITRLYYRPKGIEEWNEVLITCVSLESFRLKKTELTLLSPNTEYEFFLEGKDKRSFRTLPDIMTAASPLRVAIGGDAYKKLKAFGRMNRVVAAQSPAFVIMGGDIAYANQGKPMSRWYAFFEEWGKTMITPEGLTIPLIGIVGNHEMSLKKGEKKTFTTFFCDFFPYLSQTSYGALQIGEMVQFFLLDTGHIAPIEGEQAKWLADSLKETKSFYKIAVYHEAAYPSIYPYASRVPALIRREWVPLFEQYGLLAAFENHNHCFKRTLPLKEGKVSSEKGVIYIGDGCWSVRPRKRNDNRWYLDKRIFRRCVSFLEISQDKIEVRTLDDQGTLLDIWTQKRSAAENRRISCIDLK